MWDNDIRNIRLDQNEITDTVLLSRNSGFGVIAQGVRKGSNI